MPREMPGAWQNSGTDNIIRMCYLLQTQARVRQSRLRSRWDLSEHLRIIAHRKRSVKVDKSDYFKDGFCPLHDRSTPVFDFQRSLDCLCQCLVTDLPSSLRREHSQGCHDKTEERSGW